MGMEENILRQMDAHAAARKEHCDRYNNGEKDVPLPPRESGVPGPTVRQQNGPVKALPGLIVRDRGQGRVDALRRSQGQ
jgi:hypothetical protein